MSATKLYSYGHLRTPSIVLKLQTLYDKLSVSDYGLGRLKPFEDVVYSKTFRELKNGKRKGLRFLEIEEIGKDLEKQKVKRWCDVEDFNPSSSKQLIKYIKWRMKTLLSSEDIEERKLGTLYYVPIDIKKKTETTASKDLKELYEKTGDKLLEATVEYRSLCTNLNNYYPNWEPWEDGCAHPKFQYKPPSVQLNSIEPNGQNLSKHTPIGQLFRKMIEAKKDHYFLEFDKSRFHVVMMGWVANSTRYMRFGMLDCHTIFTSWIIGEKSLEIDLDMDDATIRAIIKEIRSNAEWDKIRDTQAKPTVLGNQLGLGAIKMYHMNRRNMPNVKYAKWLQDNLNERFSEVDETKDSITTGCYNHPDHVITIPFGFNRYLYDVLKPQWNKKFNDWRITHGGDYEKAIAFPVQGNSFGMMRDEWYRMNDTTQGYNCFADYNFTNTIHDSNFFHPHANHLEGCIRDVFTIMTNPCSVLSSAVCPEGLIVGTGVTMGRNLQSYYAKKDGKKPYNPDGMREIEVRRVEEGVRIVWPT